MLTDFFRINLPYGIKKNSKGEWAAFNREYQPLGFNKTSQTLPSEEFDKLFVYTKYTGLTESLLLKIASEERFAKRDEKGKIQMVFLYNDGSNPMKEDSNSELWKNYFAKLKLLSKVKKAR